MSLLEGHLATVPFEEEISKLGKGDCSTVVSIDSEHVLYDIVDLTLRLFMKNFHHKLFDAFNIDLSILVLIFLEWCM